MQEKTGEMVGDVLFLWNERTDDSDFPIAEVTLSKNNISVEARLTFSWEYVGNAYHWVIDSDQIQEQHKGSAVDAGTALSIAVARTVKVVKDTHSQIEQMHREHIRAADGIRSALRDRLSVEF